MEPIEFTLNGVDYIIRQVAGRNYNEIVYARTNQRVKIEKDVCRQYGIDVSTDTNVMNTHRAIKLLIDAIEGARG
jgi:hypothetical protein